MKKKSERSRKQISPLKIILAGMFIALMTKSIIADLAIVEGASMEPVISRGTVVLLFRCAFGIRIPFLNKYLVQWKKPKAGDIVAAMGPNGKIVKSVFATGPDELTVFGGSYLASDGRSVPQPPGKADADILVIPENEFFLTGANTTISSDSRDFGTVSFQDILGTIITFKL